MNLTFNITKYAGVMAFYAVLTYIIFPAIAYFLFGKTLDAAGNGFIVGSIVSVVLWRMWLFVVVKIDNFDISGSSTFDGKPITINFNKEARACELIS